MKQEQREATTGKKKKERKENLQGESAGEKSQIRSKVKALPTRITYNSAKTCDRKVPLLSSSVQLHGHMEPSGALTFPVQAKD